MASENEMIADIVAEMRNYAKQCREENFGVAPECEAHYNDDDVEYLADRIEAAWKREAAEIEVNAAPLPAVLLTKNPENVNSGSVIIADGNKPVGNAAATREALEYASRVLAKWRQDAPFSAWNEYGEAIDRCRAALAKPPRNCDKMPDIDNLTMHDLAKSPCKSTLAYASREELLALVRWLLAPAAERKGETNGRV